MPTYVYRCPHCKHQFDINQKFSDPPITRCPNCRRKGVQKVLHPATIQFKGSGWYSTDSKRSSSASITSKPTKKETAAEPAKKEAPAESKSSGSDSD
jgi:putative FmdB family regulatory protein